ncbi:MAG: zf-HC2 domain-containing protein [Acidobacteriota bacterium]
MTCLKLRDIHEYLEGDFPPEKRKDFEGHLRLCAKCRQAVEERRILTEAASSLPPLEVPADFAKRVMSRIPAAKSGLPAWLVGLAGGLASLAGILTFFFLSGRNLAASLSDLDNSLWQLAKNATVFVGKSAALLSQAGKIISSFLQVSAKGLSILTTLVSPGTQAALIALTLALGLTLFVALKKKIRWGE